MRRLFTYIIFAIILFASCEYETYHEPYSDFGVNSDLITPGEVISFSNYSRDAVRYEWNFGDGTSSNAVNPSHYYSREGVYEVSLTASYGGRVDHSYMTIEVYYTTLEVVVRDWETDELIPKINVILYEREYDYMHYENVFSTGVTDYSGKVIFKNLDTRSYYMDVHNSLYTNEAFLSDDINFVRTSSLSHAMHNVFVAYVDYDPVMYKSAKSKPKVRKIEKSTRKRTLKDKQELQ